MTQPPKDPIESRRKLHQLLLDQKLYSKSDVEFETQFANPESRAKLHQLMLDKSLYSKSVDDFDMQFFGDLKKKEEPVQYSFTGQLDLSQPLSNQLQGGSENIQNEPVIGTIPVTSDDDSEVRAEKFLADADLKDQLEQGRLAYEQGKTEVPTNFGTKNLDEIADEVSKKTKVVREPSIEPGSTDFQSQLNVPLSKIEMDVNRFEATKDKVKNLQVKEDKAKYADELQKFSTTAIDKIDKQLDKLPSNLSFEDTGMGGVSSPKNEEKEILEMAKSILEEVRDTPDKGGFWEGLSSKGFSGVLPFVSGLEELPKLRKLRDVSLEAQAGDKENEFKAFMGEEPVDNLAPEKRQLLSAEAIKQEFQRAKENPGMYRFGRVLAEMIPYMGEYVATSGAYTGAKTAVTAGLTKVLKTSAQKAIIRNGVIKPLSTLAALTAQTGMNPTRIASTTFERMTPQLKTTLALDPDELKGVVGEGGEGFNKAFAKAFGTNAMELLTERFGQWSSEAGDAIKAAGYWLPNVTLGKWMAKRGYINLEQANKAAKTLGWDGILKEIYGEEYPNKLLQEAITGDQNILTELNKPGPPSAGTLEFFNPLSDEFIDMMVPSLILGGGPLAYGAFKKWATSEAPTVAEQTVNAPAGDLGVKPKEDEKPKEPTRPVAAAEVPKVETQESVPVQGEQEVKGEKVEPVKGTKYNSTIQEVDINELGFTELEDGKIEKAKEKDVEKYAERFKAGENKTVILVGRGKDGKLYVIDGHRRVLAAKKAGINKLKAIVRDRVTEGNKGIDANEIDLLEAEANQQSEQVAPETIVPPKVKAEEGSPTEEVTYIKQELDGRVLYEDVDGNKYEARPTRKNGYYDIYKNGKKLDSGAAKFSDIQPVIEQDRQSEKRVEEFKKEQDTKGYDVDDLVKNLKRVFDKPLPEGMTGFQAHFTPEGYRTEIRKENGKFNYYLNGKDDARPGDLPKLTKAQKSKPIASFDNEIDAVKYAIAEREKYNNELQKIRDAQAEERKASKETFGKFKVIGVNSEGNKVGEDKNGVRGVLKGNVIVSQPVGIIPGQGYSVSSPEGQFLTTEESKSQADKVAKDAGFDSPSHLINSVKKRTGQEFENVQDIPKELINRVVNERNLEELPPAEEKPKITQIKEANPERILVVKPTSDKPSKLIEAEEAVKKMLAGSSAKDIEDAQNGLGISAARFAMRYADPKKNQELYDKVYNLFFDTFKQKAPRKSDAKFDKARKSAAELLDLIGPGLKIDEQYDPERSEKIARKAIQMVGDYLDAGLTRFAEMVQDVIETFGEPSARVLFGPMKEGYGAKAVSVPDEVADKMDDLKTIRAAKIEDFLNTQDGSISDTDGAGTSELPGGTQSEGTGDVNETEPIEGQTDEGSGASTTSAGGSTKAGKKRSGSPGSGNRKGTGTGLEPSGIAGGEQGTTGKGRKELDVNDQNHVIEEADEIVPSGESAKIKANIAAIKLVKKLQEENRNATPEEKKILAKFVGWGGLASVLDKQKARSGWDDNWNKKYEKYHKEIADLLTEDEFNNAVNSTINAHYTDRRVITSIWDLVKRLGFTGGNVMEPSAGVGHFFGLMPQEMAQKSNLKAYELDALTGQILSKLYPDANVRVTGYEEAVEGSNTQDLVISNVPFGKTAPFDKRYKDLSKFSLHNYFIAKGIQQLKPGGLGVFITSSSSMDNGASANFREWTNNQGNADFIGAIRLPNNAFAENAGTQVTTDILIYKKRTSDSAGEFNQDYRVSVSFKETKDSKGNPTEIFINEYFKRNPEMMLGEMMLAHDAGSGGLYSADSQTLKAPAGQNTMELLNERISRLPENVFGAEAVEEKETEKAELGDKEGTLKEQGGKLYFVENGELHLEPWGTETIKHDGKTHKKVDVVKDYTQIKTVVNDLIREEQNNESNEVRIEELRKELNKKYDNFVKKYGQLNRNKKIEFLEEDADHISVTSLENVTKESTINEKTGRVTTKFNIAKADIFNKRVNFPYEEPNTAESPSDAVSISLSYRNKVDLPYIASLLGRSEADAKKELIDNNLVYENPKTGLLEEADAYLSGYVRTKLAEAEAEVKANPDFERNVEALKKVIPKTIPAQLIEFRLGSNWLPGEVIDKWVKNELDIESKIRYNPLTGSWVVNTLGGTYGDKNRITYATKKFTGLELVEKALNLRQPEVVNVFKEPGGGTRTVKDLEATAEAQGKMQELADLFYNYVKGNKEMMSELEVLYNEKYNDFIEKKQSLPAFTYFPNANHETTLRLHQRRAVIRSLNDSTLLAHQVGTGKTFTLITIAMEMRRLRIAKKPMIVVQNATIEQFTEKFKELYPGAKVLMPSKKEMDTKNRQKLFNKIAYNDWDAVIIPQSFINFIPDDPAREKAYLSEQIAELEIALDEAKAEGDRGAISDINATLKKLDNSMGKVNERENPKGRKVKDVAKSNLAAEKAIKRQSSRRKDDVVNFENMGVDALLVDEAHAYKKLGFFTKMNKIRGIDTGRSQRAFGIMMKIKYIQEKNKGKNVIFSTGTPITNTMAELWTMMRYISPDVLEKYNIKGFDEFASTFGNVEPSLEFNASGSFKIVDRFKSYINAPELLTAFRSKTDVVLTEDIPEFKEDNSIPKLKEQADGKRGFTQITMPQTQSLLDFMEWAKATLKEWEKLPGKEKRRLRHVPLMVFNRAKQAAIDMRLLKPTNIDDPGSKTNRVVKEVKRIYDESTSYQGTQMIFSDMYQSPEVKDKYLDEENTLPNPAYGLERFNLYEDIKKKLVKMGIPEKEIALINDYEGEKRNALFESVNNGTVRILLGSTEKMGVGVNVQERLAGLHHIDAPPRPMDFEQRNGRIIRQGNLHAQMDKPIEVVTYGVEKTLDATAYQRLAIKQKFINQMMKAEGLDRNMNDAADEEDASDMSFDQMMSTLSGSQFAVLHTQKMYELRKLRTAKSNHTRNIIDYSDQITRTNNNINFYSDKLKLYEPIQDEFKNTFPEQKLTEVVINGKKVTGKDIFINLQEYIDEKLKEVDKSGMLEAKGTIKIDGGMLVTMDFRKAVNTDLLTSNDNKWNYSFKYSIVPTTNFQATIEPNSKVTTGSGLVTSINTAINKVIEKGEFGIYDLDNLKSKIEQYKKDIKALAELIDKPFDKTEKLAALEADVADLEEKMKGENKEVEPETEALTEETDPDKEEKEDEQAEKSMDDILTKGSKKAADEGYEGFSGAMSTAIPLPVVGKVKKAPDNSALLNFLATGQMTMQQLEKKLDEETKFENPEVEKRVNDAEKPEARNVSKFFDQVKLFVHETTQPLKYLDVRKWAREANLLREFKGIMDFSKAKSTLYVKTLTSNLTPIQYRILSRRIWLADLLESVQKGENMRGIDGKYSFGFNSEAEIQKHFDKYDKFMQADDKILEAYKMRQAFMGEFKKTLVDSGLLQETDIENYYHRRVLEYQADQEHDRSILFGREIGDKKRGFQKQRTGTRGLDYSTNFIETDWKVVTEGLYEIEKRKILNDIMSPFEKQLNALVKEFKTKYNAVVQQLIDVHGEESPEVKAYKKSKKQLKEKFLEDNKPEGYVFWRTDESNRLFWGKTVTQASIDKAIDLAQQSDNSGMGQAMGVIEGLINDLRPGLMVGSKRKQYMIPEQLAKQLEFMAENQQTSTASNLANTITAEWKKLVLLSPFRLVRYNINNLGSDIDRTIQVEPQIAKYAGASIKELWEYTRKGVVTPQILEAIRGGVIDSGFQISEIADLSEQAWAKALLQGGTMDQLFGKELLKDFAKKAKKTPGNLWNKYLNLVTPYVQFRENVLRYAAYKLAVEKVEKGNKFYWASNPKAIDAIDDKRQRAAKLAREVYGDYRNISVTGESLRRLAMPFYSWFEINMKTHLNLIKNAGDPRVQRAMVRSAVMRGIPAITVRIGMAYFRIAMMTTAVQIWNNYAYSIYGGDDDSEDKLRRSGAKGMNIIWGVDEKTGQIKVIPIQGAFYDFMEFFGIPVIWDDIERIMYGDDPLLGVKDTAATIGSGMLNRGVQMTTPFAKMPFELLTKQSYFPNVGAPTPIRDRWEYVAKALTLGDEYNYFLTDKPQKEGYLSRKLNNSLILREIDVETLTYYHARAIVQGYTGKKISGSDPKNPTASAKKDAEYKFMMALKNNRLDLADKHLLQYMINGGNPRDLHSSLKNLDPLSGLSKTVKPGEMKSEYQDMQDMMLGVKPTTHFGKQLTKDEVLVFKDAMRYFYKMQNRGYQKGI